MHAQNENSYCSWAAFSWTWGPRAYVELLLSHGKGIVEAAGDYDAMTSTTEAAAESLVRSASGKTSVTWSSRSVLAE